MYYEPHTRMAITWKGCAAVIWLALAVGCAGVHRGRSVHESGFLKDYSQLRPGEGDQAILTYTNPKTNFRRYRKIILEPVAVFAGREDSRLREMPPEDLQKLVDYFDATLRKNLGEQFTLVKQPGPGVMRIRVALTEARGAQVVRDTISSVLPLAIALSALKTIATGSGTAVGEASAECEILDSQTGERLGAAVDKRVGDKYTGQFDKFEKWRATQAACDYWAERLKTRLTELQSGQPAQKGP